MCESADTDSTATELVEDRMTLCNDHYQMAISQSALDTLSLGKIKTGQVRQSPGRKQPSLSVLELPPKAR